MAIPIKKFGQYVLFQCHTKGGELVFETDSLRVDFDIRDIQGWSRAKVSLFNLDPKVVGKLANGDNYVTISVAQHDSELTVVADRMYVSNALEETVVPESRLDLFCYSALRKLFLEKQIDVVVLTPNLTKVVEEITRAAEFTGEVVYKHFPQEVLDFVPPRFSSVHRGSLISCLEVLGSKSYYRFNVYTDKGKLVLMYKPDAKNVEATGLFRDSGDIVLDTRNMRSNPKIGPATLSVVANLDPLIKPSSVLDISKLLTVGTSADEETLFVAEGYLRDKVAGFAKYQVLSVQHKGSNWTDTWITQAVSTSPTPGFDMPTNKWWL